MLRKLLKYDLKNINKVLIIFYSLSITFAVITRLLFLIEDSFIMNILAQISSGITISMMFNIIINNIMRLWARFRSNFYKDESYLTHTLPVDKKTLYLSKTLASIITLLTSIIVIGVTLFIAYYSKENIEILKQMIMPLVEIYDIGMVKIIIFILYVLFLEFLNAVGVGYTGIILGNRSNNNKLALTLMYGFIIYMISQIIGLLFVFIAGIFNKDIMNLFFTNEIINIDVIKYIIYLSIIGYSIIIIINYFINIKLFNKGVNVD